jgi:hypothetical protein
MFLAVSLLLWLPAFIHPPNSITFSTYGIAYDYLVGIFRYSERIIVVIAFVALLGQAIIFNVVLVENPFFSKSVFLPALIYVILMSHNPLYLTMHPMLLANFFLIFSLKNLLNTYEKQEAFRESFNASFWVAIATLFYLPAIYFLLLIWVAFILFRISSWREWVISLIGFGIPLLMMAIVFYLADRFDFLLHYYPNNFTVFRTSLSINLHDYIFWPAYLVLMGVAYLKFIRELPDKIISMRKSFAVVNVFLLLSTATIVFSGTNPHLHSFLIFPAASVIVAYYFIETKRIVLAELLFLLLLIAIAINKII